MSENKFGLFNYFYMSIKKEHQIDALLNTLFIDLIRL